MKLHRRLFASALFLLLSPMAAHAVPITIGSLSSNDDGSTIVITDTLNNLEWLRWDQASNLNYAQTLAEFGSGGAFEGFQVATLASSTLFLNALLSDVGNSCTSSAVSTLNTACGDVGTGAQLQALLGDSYGAHSEIAWFLSDNGAGYDVGYLSSYTSGPNRRRNDWSSVEASDRYSEGGTFSTLSVPWLASRQSSPVSEPGVLALVGIGIAGLGVYRGKKRV